MRFLPTALPGVLIVEPELREDDRGFFARTWCRDEFASAGIPTDWVQCNVSSNRRAGTLRVAVAAAPWVPVERLLVHRDGEIVAERPVARGDALELPLEFARDGFVVVEVEGRADPTFRALLPGFTPLAVANPIFVDADGDGAWTAPGLPNQAPPLLRDPLRSGLAQEKR